MTEIIAEIGINHQGNLQLAKQMIETAAACGVTAVKFQKRRWQDYPGTVRMSNTFGEKMPYREHKRLLEFDEKQYAILDSTAQAQKVDWFASVYDMESLEFIKQFQPARWKIASHVAATNLELCHEIASQPGKCYLSLGMMDWHECDNVVNTCIRAKTNISENPYNDIVLMHCVCEYPCPTKLANLKMISVLQNRYKMSVGYSGHDAGVPLSLAAAALGAVAIEKHFTLDRTMPGSDHSASLEPHGLETLCRHVQAIEKGLGDGVRRITKGEQEKREKFTK